MQAIYAYTSIYYRNLTNIHKHVKYSLCCIPKLRLLAFPTLNENNLEIPATIQAYLNAYVHVPKTKMCVTIQAYQHIYVTLH